jgi:hypothetical protein
VAELKALKEAQVALQKRWDEMVGGEFDDTVDEES